MEREWNANILDKSGYAWTSKFGTCTDVLGVVIEYEEQDMKKRGGKWSERLCTKCRA